MQVNCPNCGEKVAAENINIQKMTAVCGTCDNVFQFDLPGAKIKRRKVKLPDKFTLHNAEPLHMEFWTNFRLDRNESFLSSIVGIVAIPVLLFMVNGSKGVPPVMPLVFLLAMLALIYRLALTVVNKTHIEMNEEVITITRKPIPNLFNQGYTVPLSGVTAIKYEETAISRKEAYDTPRYQVWAEMSDGSRRNIVNDMTEEYAVFIAQRLEERLHTDADDDVFQVEDELRDPLDEIDKDDTDNKVAHASRTNSRH